MFRAMNAHLQEVTLYTCSICYRHSLQAIVVADHYTDWVRTHIIIYSYNIAFLYMFRAINAHLQEVTLYSCSIWYCHSLRAIVVAGRYTDSV